MSFIPPRHRAELAERLGVKPRPDLVGPVVVRERTPTDFMAAFREAVATAGPVFVADPGWGEREQEQFAALVGQGRAGPPLVRGWLNLPTGGSAGAVKLARHDEQTLGAAVEGALRHWRIEKMNALGVLPLHHVSGLMAWLRCALSGGIYQPADWKTLEAGTRPALGEGAWFLSLVPTQLQRLLQDPPAVRWLRGFATVFIGGAPSWPELLETAAAARLPLAFTYGATETAAMVTALRPGEFLAGGRGSGGPMPHVRVTLDADECIVIESPSLFRGYWPGEREPGPWRTEDRGAWDAAGSLHVLGRRDTLIISGGEKIDPAEVERALRDTGLFDDVVVLGVPDPEWGARVVACHAGPPWADRLTIEAALVGRLSKYKWPKRYVQIDPWPRTPHGKINRESLVARLQAGGDNPPEPPAR